VSNIYETPLDRASLLLLLEQFVAKEAPRESQSARFRIAPSYGLNQSAPYPDTHLPFEDGELNRRWDDYVAGATYALRMVRAVSASTGIGRPRA
jgi:hypothetical protein